MGASRKKITIERARELAEGHGGVCLSDSLEDSDSLLHWRCSNRHEFEGSFRNIFKRRLFCLVCGKREPITLEELQEIARQRNGRCLSATYLGNSHKHRWECEHGHQWDAFPSHVKRGSWCAECAGLLPKTIKELQSLAEARGGNLLSGSYTNAHKKLEWECSAGHHFKANWNKVQQGGWCPKCSSGLGERICRVAFSGVFGKPFEKTRPDWLVSPKGNSMELDGFNEELTLAFEHQGMQHYIVDGHFMKSKEHLHERQKFDQHKRDLCQQHKVKLIEVPSIPDQLAIKDVISFIADKGIELGILQPEYTPKEIDLQQAYRTPMAVQTMKELREIAESRGGKCLSKNYTHAKGELLLECAEGHTWKSTPDRLKSGSWCAECAGLLPKTIEEMQELAAEKGGKCLSDTYKSAHSKLMWECSEGHRWMARPNLVRRGKWCPHCAGNARLTIERMREIASENGGMCLSSTYVNSTTKLSWQCELGHTWMAAPDNIVSGRWCPKCGKKRAADSKRGNIQEMNRIASERGGRCLSETYVNSQTKLIWECEYGHKWEATPNNIKRGKWCPHCAGNARKEQKLINDRLV